MNEQPRADRPQPDGTSSRRTFAGGAAVRLLEWVASGDRAAFELLYDQYSPTIYGLLLKITGDASDAADLLQETFVQAWQNASRWDASRGSELAWLITIARSRAIDRLRSRRTRTLREEEGAKEILGTRSSVDEMTDDAAEVNETRRIVREAFEELPPEQRKVLELAYFEGKTHSEIARELGQPLGSVKTRIALGMKKLRGRLVPLFRR